MVFVCLLMVFDAVEANAKLHVGNEVAEVLLEEACFAMAVGI